MSMHVAVINDYPDFLELMGFLLTRSGYTVTLIEEAQAAHGALQATPPQLIILDLRLEHPDGGWKVLEVVRLDPALARIPVIICSADQRELVERRADLERTGCAVLPKPFHLGDLLMLLDRLLAPIGGAHAPGTAPTPMPADLDPSDAR